MKTWTTNSMVVCGSSWQTTRLRGATASSMRSSSATPVPGPSGSKPGPEGSGPLARTGPLDGAAPVEPARMFPLVPAMDPR